MTPTNDADIEEFITSADAGSALAGHRVPQEIHELERRVGRREITIEEAIVIAKRQLLTPS